MAVCRCRDVSRDPLPLVFTGIKRDGSQKSAYRKISSHSLASERSDDVYVSASVGGGETSLRVEDIGEESSGMFSGDEQVDGAGGGGGGGGGGGSAFDYGENDEQDYGSFMPWIKVLVFVQVSGL